MNPVIGLKFHKSRGDSPLIAYLPTQSGGHVVFPTRRSEEDMTRTGWHLVQLHFAGDVVLADPIITRKTVQASADLLANFLDFAEDRLRIDEDKDNDLLLLYFDKTGNGPLKAGLPSEHGDINIFPTDEHEDVMLEPGWYLCQVEIMNNTTGYARPLTSKENLTAAHQLLDEHFELAHLRRSQLQQRLGDKGFAARACYDLTTTPPHLHAGVGAIY